MMATTFCSECHRPISDAVAGVRLPAFKVRLFNYVETHPRQSAREIASHFDKTVDAIRAHIYQINELMLNTAIRIRGSQLTGYCIDKGSQRA